MLIYMATCKETGKKYVGATTKTLSARIRAHEARVRFGSHYHFHNALRKYGVDGFIWEILQDGIMTREELDRREIEFIKSYGTIIKGYNISTGGGGGDNWTNNPKKEDIRERLRVVHTGKKASLESRQKMSRTRTGLLKGDKSPIRGRPSAFKGRHHTDEAKKRISKAKSGRSLTMEHRKKIGDGLRGKVFSEDHKRKISEANMGKMVSEETRRRQSDVRKGKRFTHKLTPEQVGEMKARMAARPDRVSLVQWWWILASEFSISVSVVRKIHYGYLWGDIRMAGEEKKHWEKSSSGEGE